MTRDTMHAWAGQPATRFATLPLIPLLLFAAVLALSAHSAHAGASTPRLSYSTYLGGTAGAWGTAIALDRNGNVIESRAVGAQMPLEGMPPIGTTADRSTVSKFDPRTNHVQFAFTLPGTITSLASATDGRTLVTGYTRSTALPTVNAWQSHIAGGIDGFFMALDASGHPVISSYLGGSGDDVSTAISVDPAGYASIVGTTTSADFPVRAAKQQHLGGGRCSIYTLSGTRKMIPCPDAFVVRIDPTGHIVYSAYLGGSDRDEGNAVSVDASGATYITGDTWSENFPVVRPLQATSSGDGDAFVTKLDASGRIVASTYLGGDRQDTGEGIAVDDRGAIYVTGSTMSTNFPTKDAMQAHNRTDEEGWDAFITKLQLGADKLVYSTYLGGYNHDGGAAIAVDLQHRAHVTGYSLSTDFPLVHSLRRSMVKGECSMLLGPHESESGDGCTDAFVAEVDANGRSLVYSTLIDGHGIDFARGIALDGSTTWITGSTTSRDFPVMHPLQPTNHGRPMITNPTKQVQRPNAFIAAISTVGARS